MIMASFYVILFPIFALFAAFAGISLFYITLDFLSGVYKDKSLDLVNKIALVGLIVFFVIFASFSYRGCNEILDNQVVENAE
jgi:hypothetical protein